MAAVQRGTGPAIPRPVSSVMVRWLRETFLSRRPVDDTNGHLLCARLLDVLGTIEATVVERFGKPIVGSMLVGSYASESPTIESDVDLHLFVDSEHNALALQQSKVRLCGYVVDVQIVSYDFLASQVEQGTAADVVLMYARGRVLRDSSNKLGRLHARCVDLVQAGPPPLQPREAAAMRATLASYFSAVPKNAQRDRPSAHYNMMVCLLLVYEIEFRLRRAYKSFKPKAHLDSLRAIAPDIAPLFTQAANPDVRFERRLSLVRGLLDSQIRRLSSIEQSRFRESPSGSPSTE